MTNNEFLTLAENAVRKAIETEVWTRSGKPVLGTGSAAIAVLNALRALPVEQRMEAMGMVKSGWSGHWRHVEYKSGEPRWSQIGRVHDKNSVHMDGCVPLYVEDPGWGRYATPTGYVHCAACDYIKPGRKRKGVPTCDDCHGKATYWASLPDDEKAQIIYEFNADRYGLFGDD